MNNDHMEYNKGCAPAGRGGGGYPMLSKLLLVVSKLEG